MRLFVAVRPPREACDHLAAAVAPVRSAGHPSLRWQDPARWHLTLAFLGDVPEDRVGRVEERVSAVAARHGPVGPLHLRGAGVFDQRVLWVGVEGCGVGQGADDASVGLRRLAVALQHGMRREGLHLPSRTWRAHLTLARERGSGDPGRPGGIAGAAHALAPYDGPAWSVEEVVLVRSVLGPSPVHETIVTARLSEVVRGDPAPSRGVRPA